MNKIVTYMTTIIMCLVIGAFGMFLHMSECSNAKEEVIKKIVTVEDTGISEGVQVVYDSVVVVEVYVNGVLSSTGTGFVYKKADNKAYILTNHHVISSKGEIQITFTSGQVAIGTIVSSDEYADVCVLTVDEKYADSVVSFGNSESTKIGDTVFTIGVPMGKNYAWTVTRGILSGKDRMVEVSVNGRSYDWVMKVMQTDAAINPGNSGGPLCNVNGEVIGINTLKVVQDQVEGIGFSIPIEDALEYAKVLETGASLTRPYLGIEVVPVSSTYQLMRSGISVDSSVKNGVVIIYVEDNSPATASGLQVGDTIVSINGNDVTTAAMFRYYLFKNKPGDKINIAIKRSGQTIDVESVLSEYK